MLASFARSYMAPFAWFWWYLWPWTWMAYKMSGPGISDRVLGYYRYTMKWKNGFVNSVEGPELGFRKSSKACLCWSGLRCWVYSSRCSTFMLKKFTFSLSKNTELPTSLDVVLSLFLSLSVTCSLYVWTTFPRDAGRSRFEIPPNHMHQKNNVLHIHEINTGSCVDTEPVWLCTGKALGW